MNTRSRSVKQPLYSDDIDFDDASACWRANKKACKNGTYKYVCNKTTTIGDKCNRVCYADSEFCWQHRNKK